MFFHTFQVEARLEALRSEYDAIMDGQRAERERREAHENELARWAIQQCLTFDMSQHDSMNSI